jgi:hypothetical protein
MSVFAISIRAYFSSTAQLAPYCCDYGNQPPSQGSRIQNW